jgi:5-formyltetrahydrofolate cyclo-ligase
VTTGSAAAAKAELRARVRAARASRSAADRILAGEQIRDIVLSLPELSTASVVAAYAVVGGEPDTRPLLAALLGRGVRVLLPVQRDDGDLDWATYDGPDALTAGPHGIAEPSSARLGRDAIATASVVAVPALAVDRAGRRLGQGGGFYDRALRRADPAALTVAVVYDDELLDVVPADPHDRAIGAAVTPSGVWRFAYPE